MTLVYTCKVRGVPTLHHRCGRCGGRADIQVVNGQARQVRLTGAADEYVPESIRPNQRVQIQGMGGGYELPVGQGRIDHNELRARIMGQGQRV